MPLFQSDLDAVRSRAAADLAVLRGKRIFMTGGTGFIGKWLLESLLHANRTAALELRLGVLSRDPDGFRRSHPHLAGSGDVVFYRGDVQTLEPGRDRYDYVIHGATNASARLNIENPLLMLDTIVTGTRRVLEFAKATGAGRLLNLSSGAVYGKFPPTVTHIRETDCIAPDTGNPYYTYSESKRMGELLCAIYRAQFGLESCSARIFALAGPYLPLTGAFAMGNFLDDVLHGRDIRIQGDGTAVRSYLYAADLVVWLLAILVRGASGQAYNVGSDAPVSILDLAVAVRDATGCPAAVTVEGRPDASNPVSYYVPDIGKCRADLGLDVSTPLEACIRQTYDWHRALGGCQPRP